MITYRKTKDDKWAVFGPASEVHVGTVTVTKKDQSRKTEKVVAISKAFDVNGLPHVFGYLEERQPQDNSSNSGSSRSGGRRNAETKVCWECGCTFTYADAKRGGGDWSESYCGC